MGVISKLVHDDIRLHIFIFRLMLCGFVYHICSFSLIKDDTMPLFGFLTKKMFWFGFDRRIAHVTSHTSLIPLFKIYVSSVLTILQKCHVEMFHLNIYFEVSNFCE